MIRQVVVLGVAVALGCITCILATAIGLPPLAAVALAAFVGVGYVEIDRSA